MDELDKKIIFPAEVVDNQDPMILGRVRAHPLDKNVRAALDGFNFNPTTDLWGPKDPFVCSPLLPQFISQVPEVKERVNLWSVKNNPSKVIPYFASIASKITLSLTAGNNSV